MVIFFIVLNKINSLNTKLFFHSINFSNTILEFKTIEIGTEGRKREQQRRIQQF